MRKLLVALLVLSGCTPSPAERAAIVAGQCALGVVAELPPEELMPKELADYTVEDLHNAVKTEQKVRACARKADAGL